LPGTGSRIERSWWSSLKFFNGERTNQFVLLPRMVRAWHAAF
jgi:hypothetical protein